MELPQKIYKLLEQMKDNVQKTTGKRNDLIDYQLLNDLRKSHRELYLGLEANRKINQNEKDQLDKETIYSECLEYSKNQLNTYIQQFQEIKTTNYKYIAQCLKLSKLDPLNDRKQIIDSLEVELEARKQKKIQLEQVNSEFQTLTSIFLEKEHQYFEILPEQLKQIQSELIPIINLFQLPQLALPQQQQYYKDLPQSLLQIYQKLQTKFVQLEIIKLQPTDSIYKQSEYELRITLNDGICDDQILNYFNMKLNQFYENIYPIKFGIRYFTNLDKIVFYVDRQNAITSEELFCGLIKGDAGQPLFLDAKNDEEININTRYMTFNWISSLIGFGLSAHDFYNYMQNRIYNLQLLKIQLFKLQKCELPNIFPGIRCEQQFKLTYFGNFSLFEKPPFWYDLCVGKSLESQQSRSQSSLLLDDDKLQQYVSLNYVLQGQAEHLNDCYKLILEKDNEDHCVEIGLIIPLSYPKQNARFQLISSKNIHISQKEWFTFQASLENCLIEGLQLSYQILKLLDFLSSIKQQVQYKIK